MKIYLAYAVYSKGIPQLGIEDRESENLYVGIHRDIAIERLQRFLLGDYSKPVGFIQEWEDGNKIAEYYVE